MRKISEKVIDGKKYMIGHWPVDTQLTMMTRLIKLLGEPLAMIIMGGEGSKKSILDVKLDGSVIGPAISALSLRLHEDEVKQMFRDAVSGVKCDGKDIEFNTHFMGRIMHLMKVATFCLRHQYQDFLEELPALKEDPAGTNTMQDASM